MTLPTVKDTQELKGKKILLRVDVSVPMRDGRILDDFGIRKIVPTLRFLRERGAHILIITHGEGDPTASLGPIYEYLKREFPGLLFCGELFSSETAVALASMRDGDMALFENVRKYPEEAANDLEFARRLGALADLYVNDAFSVSHREHASIVGVPRYLPSFIGLLFAEEMENLSRAFNPPHPFLFILGGIKFETKLPLLKKFLPIADRLFVGGALANDLFRKKGLEVGDSVVSGEDFDVNELIESEKIVLPVDVVTRAQNGETMLKGAEEVLPGEIIFDAGTVTLERLRRVIQGARFILWNGPLGNYEQGFGEATETLAHMLAESNATTIVGGGDTLAAIAKLNLEEKFTFVSTGGGAMLDFLANETLPGIEAIEGWMNHESWER